MLAMSSRILLVVAIVLGMIIVLQGQNENDLVNWPSFRGPNASGIAENFATPISWDVETLKNIKWKIAIPGLAHSSPIIWEDRMYITTASGEADAELKVGLYGNIVPVDDDSVHEWKVYCLDKKTGKILWERTAHKGVPKVKRHPKATHANSTPGTDGKYIVAFFGSEASFVTIWTAN